MLTTTRLTGTLVAMAALVGAAQAETKKERFDRILNEPDTDSSMTVVLPNATQGPLWPPSEVVDENGDFVLIGQTLEEVLPGLIIPVPSRAVLVSKDTVPPLDANGVEDFSNPLGATYDIIRELDLSAGSPDLDMVLYTLSYGPFEGDFGGGPRIPQMGDSPYNLNAALPSCLEIFPTGPQHYDYRRGSYPLHAAPIFGFQGDQVAYDAETGDVYDPYTGSGPNCGIPGCSGENVVDVRTTPPITLGSYVAAQGVLRIELTRYNEEVEAYTAARFRFAFRDLIPNAVYTVWTVRPNVMMPAPDIRLPDPMGVPNVFITDSDGDATFTVELPNPFPDPALDEAGVRVIGLAVDYHSDFQNWGACPDRLGPGVGIHAQFNTPVDGTLDLTPFVTQAAP